MKREREKEKESHFSNLRLWTRVNMTVEWMVFLDLGREIFYLFSYLSSSKKSV